MKITSLISRVLIAAIFVPILIFLILNENPTYYYIVVSVFIMFALFEFFAMMSKRGIKPMWIIGTLFGFLLLLYPAFLNVDYSKIFFAFAILTALLIKVMPRYSVPLCGMKEDFNTHVPSLFMSIFGIVYICFLGNFLIQIRFSFGSSLTLFLFLITWLNDTGAYFIGTTIGRHKIFPKISPKKTVEGFFGGIIFSILTGIIAKQFLNINISNFSWIGICFLLSISAHAGDLSESLLKRFAGVSNSFDLLPGHGGILDKIDSLLFTAPVFYFIFNSIV